MQKKKCKEKGSPKGKSLILILHFRNKCGDKISGCEVVIKCKVNNQGLSWDENTLSFYSEVWWVKFFAQKWIKTLGGKNCYGYSLVV